MKTRLASIMFLIPTHSQVLMARGGLYHYLAEAWAGGARDSWIWDVVMKQRLIEWRREHPSLGLRSQLGLTRLGSMVIRLSRGG